MDYKGIFFLILYDRFERINLVGFFSCTIFWQKSLLDFVKVRQLINSSCA